MHDPDLHSCGFLYLMFPILLKIELSVEGTQTCAFCTSIFSNYLKIVSALVLVSKTTITSPYSLIVTRLPCTLVRYAVCGWTPYIAAIKITNRMSIDRTVVG